MTETITLTFGDAGENHVGMEMIGDKGIIGSGFNLEDLTNIKLKIEENELFKDKLELIDLRGSIYTLHHCAGSAKYTKEKIIN